MHSIRYKITAITILAILTSILSIFAASFWIIRSETDRNSVGMMNLIDDDAQKSLEQYFGSVEQSVEVAANIAVEDLDGVLLVKCGAVTAPGETAAQTPEQRAALDDYLRGYCAKIQEFFAGVADYTRGVSAYYYCIDPAVSRSEHGFYYRKVGKTGFIEQEPLDVRTFTADEPLGASWYETAVNCGRPVWVGPYVCAGTWVCSYCVPIYKAGMLIGVMGMDIPCDMLVQQVNSIHVYDTGFVSLLAADGHVIYHPELPIAGSLDALGMQIDPEMLRRENSGEELIRYTVNGEDRQMSFSTLSNGMKLIVVAPAREINAPWIRLIRAMLLIAAAVILVFVVASLFVLRAITYPLKELTDASRRLADGDYDVDLAYHKKDEIGTLTEAFKRMRDQLGKYIRELNHQILHDRLTDLPNMRHFFDRAEQARKQMIAEGKEPVMVNFNIIGLRNYNRQYSFEEGDRLLVNFAGILLREFGDHRVCRFNGDHFAAVTDEEHVEEIVQTVLRECETVLDGKRMPIRVGIYPNRLEEVKVGVACDRAKLASDLHKGELSSSVTWYTEDMLKQGELYRHIINNLDRALSEGWIKVYYQPIIRAADGKVCDEEALARWIDPELGFLSPGSFIPALEQYKLIYKLDLYVLEQVLEKMKLQKEAGFYVVPQSINLSRMDFESCDVVEEIRRRVDDAGIERSMITIEITESVIGGDFDFMKEQVTRFQELGFPVWMDDFGSGYSSMNVLRQIHFDLIKFDMRFMEGFDEGNESKIILTELMRMAISLGTETVCEGVEKAEQAEFLQEIGCTRIQGYYYGKPLPFEGIVSLFEKGTTLKFENPEESEYYASIGRINLYDMSTFSSENDLSLAQYFNTLPMCIMEVSGTKLWFNRCNRSYRDFLERTLGVSYNTEAIEITDELPERLGPMFLRAVVQCGRDGSRAIIDETMGEDTVIHSLIRRVAVNPVTETAAVAVAVLAVSRGKEEHETGSAPAHDAPQYLSQEFSKVTELKDTIASLLDNMPCMTFTKHAKTGVYLACNQAFAEYAHKQTPADVTGLTDAEIFDSETAAHFVEDDRMALSMEEPYIFYEDVADAAGNRRQFQTTKLKYYNFAGQLCILGMCQDVTDMVRISRENATTREAYEKARRTGVVYSRIAKTLAKSYMTLLYVNLKTEEYGEYLTDSLHETLVEAARGGGFFDVCVRERARGVHPDDLAKFQALMTRGNILEEIGKNGFFALQYRLLVDGEPRYVSLRAAPVEEEEDAALVIGVTDIDAQVKREQDYERKLFSARSKARLDTLTGVKDKTAYLSMSEHLSRQIEEGQSIRYAIVLCRVEDIARVNETEGRDAGDRLIRGVCEIICETFKHSPVFRVAGDQFAVIALGHDYEKIDALTAELAETGRDRGLAVSCGMAKYDGTESAASVVARAERLCRRI